MELSRKETYRNQKVSIGVTVLSFVVMLVFFIFTNVITANSPAFVPSPQISLSMENGNERYLAFNKEEKQASSSPEKNTGSKIKTPQAEIPVEQGVSGIVNNYKINKLTTAETITSSETIEHGSQEQKTEKGTMELNPTMDFDVSGRTILTKPLSNTSIHIHEEGKVVVEITVDKNGDVTEADPNGRGTNTSNLSLKREAAKMALATKFNSQQKIEEQRGTITIIFSFN